MRIRLRRLGAPVAASGLALALAATLSGCVTDSGGYHGHPVATFRVADEESYRIELATPELVEHAQQLLAGEDVAAIPIGTVVRDEPGPNAPWSWHIDPATLQFADLTTEVCDGLPSFVEDGTVTSDQYCPWSAEVVAIDGL